jgi:DNA-binding response OmpR family regulator
LRDNLVFEGFVVECVTDGEAAVTKVGQFTPDLVLLDIMLPGASGFDVCGLLRQGGRIPIVMLSARGNHADKLRGLNLGADDYITKPFDVEELLARVRAVLRRVRPTIEQLVLGRVTVDFRARQATSGSRTLHLTHREFELLQYLAEHPARVVSRNELLREVWRHSETLITRCVDNAIVRLRKKIEPDARQPCFIHTVHGDGYRLTPEGRRQSLEVIS